MHVIAFMQVLDIVSANPEDSGPLNLNIVGRRDLSSSWVQEESTLVSRNQVLFPVRQNVCPLHLLSDGIPVLYL